MKNQFILALLAYADQRNIGSERLLDSAGISPNDLAQGENSQVKADQVELLWKNATEWSNDPQFGLHFAESMQLAALGVAGQLISTCNTIREAMVQACSMVPLVSDIFTMEVKSAREISVVNFQYRDSAAEVYPFTFRHMADYLTAFTLLEMKGLVLRKFKFRSVSFVYRIDPREYERIFQCSIKSNAENLSIEIENNELEKNIISADFEMHAILLDKVQVMLANEGELSSFSKRVHHFILTNSYLDSVSVENVAANFNMSSRNLQRKLKEEGTSFSDLVAEVHKELAIAYLRTGRYPAKEIAFLLGYREPSSFARAFKKWTGTTPSAFASNEMN